MSRPPIESTGLELELTKRTDREEHHLRRLPFVGDHSSVLLHVFIRALIFQSSTEYFLVTTTVVICTVVRQQSVVCTELHCVEKLLAQATFVCKRTSTIRLSIQNFRFLSSPVINEW